MPGRDLMVRIRADVTDFQNKLRAAKAGIAQFDQQAQKNTTKTGKALNALGLSYRGVGIAAVTSVAAIGGAMIKSAADFDQGMSNVKATGADAVKNFDALREAALKAGADTKYSATEAAGGVEALAKAGVTASDILGGGLSGALDLAAAGNLDVAGSAEAAASAMNQFGLAGEDVPHIADLLAAAAGKAQGEVSDVAMALNQAGLVANTFGYSIEETTGVLAEFAASGLTGSDAGTSLKTMLIRLAAPTDDAASTMAKYHINTRNANGELKNASQIAGELQRAFKNVDAAERDAALAAIFGQDAIRGASILYQDGAVQAQKWADAVNDTGFAADTAKTKMDNRKGDLETLKGSIDTLFIKGGGGSQGPLREFVQGLTDITNAAIDAKKALDNIGVKPLSRSGNKAGIFGDLKDVGRITSKTTIPFKVAFKLTQTESANEIAKIAKSAGLKSRDVKIALKLQGWNTKQIDAVLAKMRAIERKKVVAQLRLLNPSLTQKQIDTILQKMGLLEKPRKPTKVDVKDAATPKLKGVQAMLAGLQDKTVTVTTHYETTGTPPNPWTGGVAGNYGYAAGGKVPGSPPMNPREDNVPAMLEDGRRLRVRSGEWIINERASRLNDRYLRAINSGLDMNKMLPGFAGGGRVGGGTVSAAPDRVIERVRLDADSNGNLYAVITSVARDAVGGNNFHRASRARANG